MTEKSLGDFSANNGQRKTAAHATIIAGGMTTDEWLDDILNEMEYPNALRTDWITTKAGAKGLKAGDVRRRMSPALGRLGYVMFRSDTTDGRWRVKGKKVTVYTKPGVDVDPRKDLGNEAF